MEEAPFSFSIKRGDGMLTIRGVSSSELLERAEALEILVTNDPKAAEIFGPFFSGGSPVVPSHSEPTVVSGSLAGAIEQTKNDTPPTPESRPAIDPSKYDL